MIVRFVALRIRRACCTYGIEFRGKMKPGRRVWNSRPVLVDEGEVPRNQLGSRQRFTMG